jgi:hypothetical protein
MLAKFPPIWLFDKDFAVDPWLEFRHDETTRLYGTTVMVRSEIPHSILSPIIICLVSGLKET